MCKGIAFDILPGHTTPISAAVHVQSYKGWNVCSCIAHLLISNWMQCNLDVMLRSSEELASARYCRKHVLAVQVSELGQESTTTPCEVPQAVAYVDAKFSRTCMEQSP